MDTQFLSCAVRCRGKQRADGIRETDMRHDAAAEER